MKDIYFNFLILITLLFGFGTANAANVTVSIDNARNIVLMRGDRQLTLYNGDNIFSLGQYSYITFVPKEGVVILSIQENGYDIASYLMDSYTVYPTSDVKYILKTANLNDVQTGSFTVDVDNVNIASLDLVDSHLPINALQLGENQIKFIPGSDHTLDVYPALYNHPLYKVSKDGNPMVPVKGVYEIPITQNMVVSIISDYPDQEETVNLGFLNDGMDFVSKIVVNEERTDSYEISDFKNGNFTVRCGDHVSIYGNTDAFHFNSIAVNGDTEYFFYKKYEFTVLGTTSVVIDADKHKDITASVIVDDPSKISVYRGYEYLDDEINIVKGSNRLTLSSVIPVISVKAKPGCSLSSITLNGNDVTEVNDGIYTITVHDGDIVDIRSEAIERNNSMIVYVDQVPADDWRLIISNVSGERYSINSGYNDLKYAESEMPLHVGIFQTQSHDVYLNGVKLDASYIGGTSYDVPVTDNNSVLKIFTSGMPENYNVRFGINPDFMGTVQAWCDYISEVINPQSLVLLEDTYISFSINPHPDQEIEDIEVIANDEKLTECEGMYGFNVSGNTYVSINAKLSYSGVPDINIDRKNVAIYNIQGMLIKADASESDIRQLPEGMYIIGGRKVRVRY